MTIAEAYLSVLTGLLHAFCDSSLTLWTHTDFTRQVFWFYLSKVRPHRPDLLTSELTSWRHSSTRLSTLPSSSPRARRCPVCRSTTTLVSSRLAFSSLRRLNPFPSLLQALFSPCLPAFVLLPLPSGFSSFSTRLFTASCTVSSELRSPVCRFRR